MTQYIKKNEFGVFYYSDKEMIKLHRDDGPAYESDDGYKAWYLNGERHRENGPAVEYADGYKSWYLNGQLHRADGPAIEWTDGSEFWYLNGQLHRADGPAIEWTDGSEFWYLNGRKLSEQEHAKRTKKVPTIEINGKHFTVEELNNLIKTVK